MTSHRKIDVSLVVEILTGHRGSDVRHIDGSSNRSRTMRGLAMVKFGLTKCHTMWKS